MDAGNIIKNLIESTDSILSEGKSASIINQFDGVVGGLQKLHDAIGTDARFTDIGRAWFNLAPLIAVLRARRQRMIDENSKIDGLVSIAEWLMLATNKMLIEANGAIAHAELWRGRATPELRDLFYDLDKFLNNLKKLVGIYMPDERSAPPGQTHQGAQGPQGLQDRPPVTDLIDEYGKVLRYSIEKANYQPGEGPEPSRLLFADGVEPLFVQQPRS